MDFEEELGVGIRLANESNKILRKFMSGPQNVSYKGANDPVTEADTTLNAFLLKSLEQHFPNDAFLCEESADDPVRLGSRRLWCIDPIDGTKQFIAGIGEFSIMIGLAIDGEAVMGIVQQPVPGITYWGTLSEAWMRIGDEEPKRMTVKSQKSLSEATLTTSRSHGVPLIDEFVQQSGVQGVIRSGSVGVKCGLITSGKADLYLHAGGGTKEWDTCAPEAILRGAGGEMTDTKGHRFRYNQPDVRRRNGIVASNGELHGPCLKMLAEMGKS